MNPVVNVFRNDLNKIVDQKFKKHVIDIIDCCPSYMLEKPSSSSGKYHMTDEINKDGLIIHTKRCLAVADEIIRMYQNNQRESDVLIAACILHDIVKYGDPPMRYTTAEHPTLAYKIIDLYLKTILDEEISIRNMIRSLSLCVLLHSGQWTPRSGVNIFEEYAKGWQEDKLFYEEMHLIDYIASRRTFGEMFQQEWADKVSIEAKQSIDH